MRTILLTSTGTDVKNEFSKVIAGPANEVRLAHIITASKPEKNKSYLKADKKELSELGYQIYDIDIEGKNEGEIRELLKDKDVIYVQGGNTFYLMKYVRESGFDKVVKEIIDKGVPYIGVSAGSIVCGPTIETSNWKGGDKNIVGLTNLSAMNLVDFNIFVHYESEHKEILQREIPKSKYPVRILTDNQAILVKDDKIEFVGNGEEIKINF